MSTLAWQTKWSLGCSQCLSLDHSTKQHTKALFFPSHTLGGLTVSDHEGPHFVPWGLQLPFSIFSAHAFEEPPPQQETDQLVLICLSFSSSFWCLLFLHSYQSGLFFFVQFLIRSNLQLYSVVFAISSKVSTSHCISNLEWLTCFVWPCSEYCT